MIPTDRNDPGPGESCFVVMPISTPVQHFRTYQGDPEHFRHVRDHLFARAIERAGFTMLAPDVTGSDVIHAATIANIRTADLVLCDMSSLNANVFFELGVRTALNRPVALVRDEHTPIPFDVSPVQCHLYDAALSVWLIDQQVDALARHLREVAERSAGVNPLWQHLGAGKPSELPAAGPDGAATAPDTADELPLTDLVEQIAAITYHLNATLSVESVEPNRIVLNTNGYLLGPRQHKEIEDLARAYGLEVDIVGM